MFVFHWKNVMCKSIAGPQISYRNVNSKTNKLQRKIAVIDWQNDFFAMKFHTSVLVGRWIKNDGKSVNSRSVSISVNFFSFVKIFETAQLKSTIFVPPKLSTWLPYPNLMILLGTILLMVFWVIIFVSFLPKNGFKRRKRGMVKIFECINFGAECQLHFHRHYWIHFDYNIIFSLNFSRSKKNRSRTRKFQKLSSHSQSQSCDIHFNCESKHKWRNEWHDNVIIAYKHIQIYNFATDIAVRILSLNSNQCTHQMYMQI